MSIAIEKVAPPLMPPKPKRVRPYKARMATKVKWALGDAMSKSVEAQSTMQAILDWVEAHRQMLGEHPTLDAHLGRLDHHVARLALSVSQMERILAQAVAESKTDSKL
jgi:hypothetical protein